MHTSWMVFLIVLQTGLFYAPGNQAGLSNLADCAAGLEDESQATEERGILVKEKLFSIGSFEADDNYSFNWVQDITTDAKGNIYVCDSRDKRIQVYDQSGRYKHSCGRAGGGPGELQRPISITTDDACHLFVRDDLNYRVSQFDAGGAFVSSFQYPSLMGDNLQIDDEGNILMDLLSWDPSVSNQFSIVSVFSAQGEVIDRYGRRRIIRKNDGNGRPAWSSHQIRLGPHGLLYVAFPYPYQIEVYQNSELVHTILRDSPLFTRPKRCEVLYGPEGEVPQKMTLVKQRSYIWNLFHLPGGKLMAVIRDAGEQYETNSNVQDFSVALDIFDAQGSYLNSYNWDWQNDDLIKHVDAEGYVYTNAGDSNIVPGVSKWRLHFK